MPYAKRNFFGQIESLHQSPAPGAEEAIDPANPEVRAFLGLSAEASSDKPSKAAPAPPADFDQMDADFVRVLEDIIDLLIVKNVITNSTMSAVIDTARDAIREGESIANPLKKSGEFPPLVYHMVGIGERSGQLEDMLLNVADSYESSVNVRIGALTALLEPMMIVLMGAVIAFVAFSILMPILQMNSMVR
jgi:hypothetical protein